MKYLVFGDIHGRTIWKDIIEKEQPDRVIFLGDYVSTHGFETAEQQIKNLKEILAYKDEHPDTIMLRGNHDTQHLGYYWAQCSGWDGEVARMMAELKDEFLQKTQWVFQIPDTNIICSHAGVSETWFKNILKMEDCEDWVDKINTMEPSEKFGFTGGRWDCYGTDPEQSITWIRPETLIRVAKPGYTYIVGHTPEIEPMYFEPVWMQPEERFKIWLNDCLGDKGYTIVDNGLISSCKL